MGKVNQKTFELNKVYQDRETGIIYYVRKVKRIHNRNLFLLRKVTKSGGLGSKLETFYKRGRYELREDLQDEVRIVKTVPSARRKNLFQIDQEKKYKVLVLETRRYLARARLAMKANDKSFAPDELKYTIAQYAFAATSIVCFDKVDGKKSKYKTVKQFAKDIRMSKSKKYYDWLMYFYSARYPTKPEQLRKHFSKAKDRTLVQVRNSLEKRWHSIYGFSPRLDYVLELHRDTYESLIIERGIYLDPSESVK